MFHIDHILLKMSFLVYPQLSTYVGDTRSQVNLSKVACPLELIKKVINPRERILVLNSDFIELAIVTTYSNGTILLLRK